MIQLTIWRLYRVVTCVVMSLVLAQTGNAQDLTGVRLVRVQNAAENGSSVAQVELADRYIDGIGVLQNFATAAVWYKKAAEHGEAKAQNELGKLYHTGFGVARDVPEALRWLLQATQAGTPQFLFDYASVLETPDGGAAFAEAAHYYRRAADAGHLEARVSLAVLYQNGTGVPQDLDQARAFYEVAVQEAHPRALNNLGLLYVRGDGVAQDYGRAAQLFTQAAEMGVPSAMTNLGVMHENGFGVPLDEERAAALYRMAGSGAPNRNEPSYIYDARLAPLDTSAKSIEILRSASKAGDPVSQFQLGWVLVTRTEGGYENMQEAARLFTQASEAGHGPAMANLSVMYFKGQGLPQDYMLGHMWLLLANQTGVNTRSITAAYGAKVTANQVNMAQKQALLLSRSQSLSAPERD